MAVTRRTTTFALATAVSAVFGTPGTSPHAVLMGDTARPCRAPPVHTPGVDVRGTLRGDVDGDRRPDRASVLADFRDAARGCRFWLVVRSAKGQYAARIEQTLRSEEVLRERHYPQLSSLVALEGARARLSVAVQVDAGASVQFIGVYGVHDGRLVRLRVRYGAHVVGSVFGVGASGRVAETVDCDGPRRIIGSQAERTGRGGWTIERRFYRLERGTFEPVRTHRLVGSLDGLREFRRVPGAVSLLEFPSCARARHRNF